MAPGKPLKILWRLCMFIFGGFLALTNAWLPKISKIRGKYPRRGICHSTAPIMATNVPKVQQLYFIINGLPDKMSHCSPKCGFLKAY